MRGFWNQHQLVWLPNDPVFPYYSTAQATQAAMSSDTTIETNSKSSNILILNEWIQHNPPEKLRQRCMIYRYLFQESCRWFHERSSKTCPWCNWYPTGSSHHRFESHLGAWGNKWKQATAPKKWKKQKRWNKHEKNMFLDLVPSCNMFLVGTLVSKGYHCSHNLESHFS